MTVNIKDGSKDYILATGAAADRRLELQHQIQKADSYDHLKKANLTKGQVVWDIGCGNGVMTEYLAETVGATGHVYAVDISSAQLKLTEQRIASKGFANVTFIHGDILELKELPKEQADIVYMRYVLMHQRYPENVIAAVKKLLKPGGVVASQESVLGDGVGHHENGVLSEYINTVIALGAYNGLDFNLGSTLKELYQAAAFEPVEFYYLPLVAPTFIAKQLIEMSISEWKDKAIEAKLTTQKQVDVWLKITRELPDDESPFPLRKHAYGIARKP